MRNSNNTPNDSKAHWRTKKWPGCTRWRETATLLWWVGVLGAVAAVTTGLIAYSRVEHSELGHAQMTLHRNLALAVVAILIGVALWRWRHPQSRGAAFAGVIGAFGLLGVGYLGGDLVFRHGIGIPTETVEQVMMERSGRAHGHAAESALPADHGEGEVHQHP